MISVLTRLGLDPWKEADRLSSLSTREAVEQLARLTAELPGMSLPLSEAREIAARADLGRVLGFLTRLRVNLFDLLLLWPG